MKSICEEVRFMRQFKALRQFWSSNPLLLALYLKTTNPSCVRACPHGRRIVIRAVYTGFGTNKVFDTIFSIGIHFSCTAMIILDNIL